MSVRIIRLGTERATGEGIRIGAVRRPPRGVPKERFASDNWYDAWLPQLSPSAELVKQGQAAANEKEWRAFERKYRSELSAPDTQRLLAFLATLSRTTDFSIGCYCENEERCHRSVLRTVFTELAAAMK